MLGLMCSPIERSACICAATRVAYVVKMEQSLDKSYYASPVVLLCSGEMTSGFLLLGVPSIPRILKDSPLLNRLHAKVRSLMGNTKRTTQENSRRGLPSWYRKPESPQKKQNTWSDYMQIDEQLLLETLPRNDTVIAPKALPTHKEIPKLSGGS